MRARHQLLPFTQGLLVVLNSLLCTYRLYMHTQNVQTAQNTRQEPFPCYKSGDTSRVNICEDRLRKWHLLPWETICSNSQSSVRHCHLAIEHVREGLAPWAANQDALTRGAQQTALMCGAWKSHRDSRNPSKASICQLLLPELSVGPVLGLFPTKGTVLQHSTFLAPTHWPSV